MAIERDELTNQLNRIAKALKTGVGSGPDTIPMAATLMHQASTRLRKYEDLIDELERWRDDHERIEQSFTFP